MFRRRRGERSQPQLIVHVGTQKTGSTAIQAALLAMKDELVAEGLWFHGPLTWSDALPKLPWIHAPDPQLESDVRAWIESCLATQPAGSVGLVSLENLVGAFAEGFTNTGVVAAALRRVTAGVDVRIVCYVRRQDTFAESTYAQVIKEGYSPTFRDFIDALPERAYDWCRLLDHFAAEFGRTNVVARSYDRCHLPSSTSLLDDFAGVIGSQSLKRAPLPARSVNPSYPQSVLEVARRCNEQLDPAGRQIVRAVLERFAGVQPAEPLVLFAPSERTSFLQAYARSNERLSSDYFAIDGDAFGPLAATLPIPADTSAGDATAHGILLAAAHVIRDAGGRPS